MTEIGSSVGSAIGGLASGLGRAMGSLTDGLGRLAGDAVRSVLEAGPLALGLIGLVLLLGLVLVARR